MADPFADAGFVSTQKAAPSDPFSAAGFAPAPPQADAPGYGAMDFARDVVGGTAAALNGVRHGMAGNLPDYINAALGTPIRMAVGMQGPVAAFNQGLDEQRQYRDRAKEYPIANIGGQLTGGVSGALLTAPAMEMQGGARAADLMNYMARNGAYGGLVGWLSGDTPEERIKGANEGVNVGATLSGAGPVAGALLQAPVNAGRSVVNTVRNLFSNEGRDAIAGQVLREASGDFANTAARSPIPGLQLRTAQATGNPGLAALERTLASEPGAAGANPMQIVQNGRTAEQTQALTRALIGDNAGIEPAILTNQASAAGVQAIQGARAAAREVEQGLWNHPDLQGLNLNRDNLVNGVNRDVAALPPSFRRTIQSGPLGGFVDDLAEGGQHTTIQDVNALRSRVLEQARAARAAGDNVTAGAAEALADSMLTRLGAQIDGTGAQTAYQAARDFTRQRAQAFGHPEFDAILRPNRAGNMRANDETAFGRFFDMNGGTDTGLTRLQGVSDLLRANGRAAEADALDQAARDYVGPSILRQARAGSGVDAAGLPNLNVNTMTSTVNRVVPALSGAPMTRALAGEAMAAGNAAELLGRPASLRGDMNSTTYEKLRNRDLVSAVLGQAGSSSLGALGGGVAAAEYGPDTIPWYLRVPGGMMAGALAGRAAGPYLGKGIAHIPGVSAAVNGPTNDIVRRVGGGLASPAEYERLLMARMLDMPGLLEPGALSLAAPAAARAAIPLSANRQ